MTAENLSANATIEGKCKRKRVGCQRGGELESLFKQV